MNHPNPIYRRGKIYVFSMFIPMIILKHVIDLIWAKYH